MTAAARTFGPSLMPAMRYRDVAAAIAWLCSALGFEEHFVARDENDGVLYAQLTFGNGMIMVGPVQDSPLDRLMKQPDEIGGAETQSCYFVVTDADAHYARAVAAGAEIVLDIKDYEYGGRGYSCRDPEGHIWTFGTFDPWAGQPVTAGAEFEEELTGGDRPPLAHAVSRSDTDEPFSAADGFSGEEADRQRSRLAGLGGKAAFFAAGFLVPLLLITGLYAAGTWPFRTAGTQEIERIQQRLTRESMARILAGRAARTSGEQAAKEQRAREKAERTLHATRQELARERGARETVASALDEARVQMVQVQAAKDATEQSLKALREDLAKERRGREGSEQALLAVRDELAKERKAREAVERQAQSVRDELARERKAREATERAGQGLREDLAKERKAREAAERDSQSARQDLAKEKSSREAAERAAQKLRDGLTAERTAKEQALKMAGELRKLLAKAKTEATAAAAQAASATGTAAAGGETAAPAAGATETAASPAGTGDTAAGTAGATETAVGASAVPEPVPARKPRKKEPRKSRKRGSSKQTTAGSDPLL